MKNIREIIQNTLISQNTMIDELVRDDQTNDLKLNEWSSLTFSYCIKDCNENLDISDKDLQIIIENEFQLDLRRLNKRIVQIWG